MIDRQSQVDAANMVLRAALKWRDWRIRLKSVPSIEEQRLLDSIEILEKLSKVK